MNIDEALRQAEHDEVFLAQSDWFEDPSPEELQDAYARFEQEFDNLLPQLQARLGVPDFTETSAPELRDDWYGEAMRLAGWKREDGYLLLAFGQHDQETPVFVSLGVRGT